MGGALGTVLFAGERVLSTAASLLGKDNDEEEYYEEMARIADEQAKQMQENAKRNAEYIFQDAAYQNTQLSRDYAQLLGQQKTALAASGLGKSSVTAQKILKNSRLNVLLDQELLNENMKRSLYEHNTTSSLQVQQYQTQSEQYRTAASLQKKNFWNRLGNTISGFIFR